MTETASRYRRRTKVLWRAFSVVLSLSIALVLFLSLVAVMGLCFSFEHSIRLTFVPPDIPMPVHVVCSDGRVEIGTVMDVASMSDFVQWHRAGTLGTAYRVTSTIDWFFGGVQVTWMAYDGTGTDWGIGLPLPVSLVLLLVIDILAVRVLRWTLRRNRPVSPDVSALATTRDERQAGMQ
jgi:hypothetical protein